MIRCNHLSRISGVDSQQCCHQSKPFSKARGSECLKVFSAWLIVLAANVLDFLPIYLPSQEMNMVGQIISNVFVLSSLGILEGALWCVFRIPMRTATTWMNR